MPSRHCLKVFDGFARREDVNGLAVPRQSDVGGAAAPLRRMSDINLVERPPLPSVDRAGVAVLDAVELARLRVLADNEADALRLVAPAPRRVRR